MDPTELDQSRRPAGRRETYVVTIWCEPDGGLPVWRGVLEAGSGQRRYFSSTTDLARLLAALSGWQDPDEIKGR